MSTAIELEPGHDRRGGVWDYMSPSRLNCWLACPLKFRLKYIDSVRTPTTPSLFLGKVTHAALERYYRHKQLGIVLPADELVSSIATTWDQAAADESAVFDSAAAEQFLKEQAGGLVRAYLAQIPADEPQPLGVEVTMQAPLVDPKTGEDLGIPLLGVTDLILGEDDGPLICDFKTSSRTTPPFEISHEIQLSAYSYLFREMAGIEEAGLEIRSLIKTRQPKVEIHRYSARTGAHFRRLFAIVREYLEALDSGRFNFRPGWGCGVCDFRESRCRVWAG